jgi:8-oxo-dGTP diphosphatase
MNENLEPLRVVAAVIVDDDRILACRRAPGKASAGLWEFPGGKIEGGETPEAALVREIREELGVDIEVGELIGTDITPVGVVWIELSCYWARLVDGRPLSSTDHDELSWLPAGALGELRWATPDLPAVALLTAGGS